MRHQFLDLSFSPAPLNQVILYKTAGNQTVLLSFLPFYAFSVGVGDNRLIAILEMSLWERIILDIIQYYFASVRIQVFWTVKKHNKLICKSINLVCQEVLFLFFCHLVHKFAATCNNSTKTWSVEAASKVWFMVSETVGIMIVKWGIIHFSF